MAQGSTNEAWLRVAVGGDIPALAVFHRKMFEEIWQASGIAAAPGAMQAVEEEYGRKLSRELADGSCTAWVVEEDGRVVAGGAVSTVSYVPVPHDPACTMAFLHSVYTETGSRHHGYARMITDEAVRFCKSRGIKRLYLFASEAGRPVYEKSGFGPVPNMMQKYIL
ncbi:MAG: GNAT family N-acetyltransferase [Methanoregula sp.]|jgi:GNAT superfamily N-acetyltransferase